MNSIPAVFEDLPGEEASPETLKFICVICGKEGELEKATFDKIAEQARKFQTKPKLPTVCERCEYTANTPIPIYGEDNHTVIGYKPPPSLLALKSMNEGRGPKKKPLTIPPDYLDTVPERLPDLQAYRKAIRWTYQKKGLTFHGKSGSGKTRTAWKLLQKLQEKGTECYGIDAGKFGDEASDKFRKGWGPYWLDTLIKIPVLLIDDLGNESKTERAEASLFSLIKRRTDASRPIIVTTQSLGSEIVARGLNQKRMAAMVRRLRENTYRLAFHKPPDEGEDTEEANE
jgi:DNA replication protein DnaC